MKIGCVKEIKTQEYRVGLIPEHVHAFVEHGHEVYIEKGAGIGSGFSDDSYQQMGAKIIDDAKTIWDSVELLIKVKEPLESEYPYFREDLILFTYLHLAANEALTKALLDSKMTALAYETLEVNHALPLLKPMSEIAGRLSIQEAAKYLEKPMGGKGKLLAGVPGVKKGHILILGAGNAGMNAAKVAVGLGAQVSILDKNIEKLEYIEHVFGDRIQTLYSTKAMIESLLPSVDVVIGAVLVAGAKAPKLISRKQLALMEKGSVLVDIAIDQGGCFEMSHPTTHNDPIFDVDGIIHYCVANMPGAVAMTSTTSLTNAAFYYELLIADLGLKKATEKEKALVSAINTHKGKCIHPAVAQTFGLGVELYNV